MREKDPAFEQLHSFAAGLTPFAVEMRYDAEFWPTKADTLEVKGSKSNSCHGRGPVADRLIHPRPPSHSNRETNRWLITKQFSTTF